MKYCLDGGHPIESLKDAEQIRIRKQNFDLLYKLLDIYPDKEFIFVVTEMLETEQWTELIAISEKHNLVICASSQLILATAIELHLKAYYGFPITTFYELNALKDLGVCYVLIESPLIFDIKQVADVGIPVRVYPNLAYENYLAHSDGIHGGWIRPEDVEYYEPFVDSFDFYDLNDTELTLFRIYKQGYWNGDLGILIKNLDFNCRNDLIPQQSIMPVRLTCGQSCERNHHCHICDQALRFETVIRKDIKNIENRITKLIEKS